MVHLLHEGLSLQGVDDLALIHHQTVLYGVGPLISWTFAPFLPRLLYDLCSLERAVSPPRPIQLLHAVIEFPVSLLICTKLEDLGAYGLLLSLIVNLPLLLILPLHFLLSGQYLLMNSGKEFLGLVQDHLIKLTTSHLQVP